MQVELYTTKQCIKCIHLKNELSELNIPYEEIDVFKHKKSFDKLDGLGLLRLPVIKIGTDKYLERPTIQEVVKILNID